MSEGNEKKDREVRIIGLCSLLGIVAGFAVGYSVSGKWTGGLGGAFPGFFLGMLLATIVNGLGSSDSH